uniref:Uncharacterized protein n=1 Tax=Corethron hystrix TaxID=216773 RepID=A0A7S1BXW9_9STRA
MFFCLLLVFFFFTVSGRYDLMQLSFEEIGPSVSSVTSFSPRFSLLILLPLTCSMDLLVLFTRSASISFFFFPRGFDFPLPRSSAFVPASGFFTDFFNRMAEVRPSSPLSSDSDSPSVTMSSFSPSLPRTSYLFRFPTNVI